MLPRGYTQTIGRSSFKREKQKSCLKLSIAGGEMLLHMGWWYVAYKTASWTLAEWNPVSAAFVCR